MNLLKRRHLEVFYKMQKNVENYLRWTSFLVKPQALELRKKCPYSEIFGSAFSRIRTEHGEVRSTFIQVLFLLDFRTKKLLTHGQILFTQATISIHAIFWPTPPTYPGINASNITQEHTPSLSKKETPLALQLSH